MSQSATAVRRDHRPTIALIVACASLLLSLISCGLTVLTTVTADRDPLPVQAAPQVASAAQIEAVAHVVLPPGTVILTAAYSDGLETRMSARLRIPRAALDAFLSAGRFTATPTPGLRAVTESHDVGEGNLWHPQKAVNVAGFEEQQPIADGTRRSVLLDLDAPDTVTIYLYANRN